MFFYIAFFAPPLKTAGANSKIKRRIIKQVNQDETIILKFKDEYEFNNALEEIYYAYKTAIAKDCDYISKLLMEYRCDDRF